MAMWALHTYEALDLARTRLREAEADRRWRTYDDNAWERRTRPMPPRRLAARLAAAASRGAAALARALDATALEPPRSRDLAS
jgi:hypothetical protein